MSSAVPVVCEFCGITVTGKNWYCYLHNKVQCEFCFRAGYMGNVFFKNLDGEGEVFYNKTIEKDEPVKNRFEILDL